MRGLPLSLLVLALVVSGCSGGDDDPAGSRSDVMLSDLDGATTPTPFVLVVDTPKATTAKLVVDGDYVGRESGSPPRFTVTLAPGVHKARVRAKVDGKEVRTTAEFTVVAGKATPTTSTTTPTTTAIPQPSSGNEQVVSTPEQLRAAMAAAQPGTIIRLADGEYRFDDRLEATASGTAAKPITLRGSRRAMIRTKNPSGDYGLHITGDHWRIEGLTVAHATKGIVLDGSVGTVIDGVEVYDIGDEGIHFRACSSDGVLRRSFVHDTGRNSPQYGEGVYVGSANSNWGDFQCTDAKERVKVGDNTERVLVEGNTFEDITAEGADLKEGTDSGTLRRNVFRRVGGSGKNSADSAVDAKGNGWVIEGNTLSEADAPWDDDGQPKPSELQDGYQSHSVYDGYGTGNVFRANKVVGKVPGFGIGLYPALENVVTCDNSAPAAADGLVGDNGSPGRCGD